MAAAVAVAVVGSTGRGDNAVGQAPVLIEYPFHGPLAPLAHAPR
jgi:hypothetical protein